MTDQNKSISASQSGAAGAEAENQDEIDKIMSEIEQLQQEMSSLATPAAAAPNAPAAATSTPAPATVPVAIPIPEPTETVTPVPPAAVVATEPNLMSEPELAAEPGLSAEPVMTESEPLMSAAEPATEPAADNGSVLEEPIVEQVVQEIMAEASGHTENPSDQDLEAGILKEFSGGGDEPWLEATLANMPPAVASSGKGILDSPTAAVPDSSVDDAGSDAAAEIAREIEEEQKKILQLVPNLSTPELVSNAPVEGSAVVSMNLQGNMTVRLSYENLIDVTVGFQGENILIKLSDGTEFKIPTQTQRKNKQKIS